MRTLTPVRCLLLALALPACRGAQGPVPALPATPTGRIVHFAGACDASGAVPLSRERFAVADDEDSVLRVYDADRGGESLHAVDVAPQLDLRKRRPEGRKPRKVHPDKADKPRKLPETDLEAATRLGDHALWLTSHGRDSKGKFRAERLRLFATPIPGQGATLTLTGQPFATLLDALLQEPALQRFDLAAAAELAPKDAGGLNLEGLTARPDGGVFIGFRNPVPAGKALLVPLDNPLEVVAGAQPRLGPPVLLDLGGLGIRSLSWWRGRYLIIAGPIDAGTGSRLYVWPGPGQPAQLVTTVGFGDLNPEGFFTPEDRDEILVLSDDGARLVDGEECKRLENTAKKAFRGMWVQLPQAATAVVGEK